MAQGDIRIGVGVEGRRQVEQEFDRVDQAVDKVERSLHDLDDAADRTGREFRDLSDDTDRNLRRMADDTDRTVDQVDRDLRRMGSDLDRAGRDMRGLADDAEQGARGIRDAFGDIDLQGMLGNLPALGRGGLIAGAVAGATSLATTQGQQERDSRILASRIGLDPGQVNEIARTVYALTPQSEESDVREALIAVNENLGGLAQSREDIITLTQGLLTLQAQGIGDTSEIARAIANAGGAFGEDDPERVLDLFAASVQGGADRSRDLVDTLVEYSGNLANLGLTIEDAFNIFVAGANPELGLFNLDKVADAVRELQVKVGEGGDEVDTALEEIGLLPGRVRNQLAQGGDAGRDAFQAIVTGLRDVDNEARQLQLGQALFGAPFEDLGAGTGLLSALDLTQTALGDTTGALQEMNDVAQGGWMNEAHTILRGLENQLYGVVDAATDAEAALMRADQALIENRILAEQGGYVAGTGTFVTPEGDRVGGPSPRPGSAAGRGTWSGPTPRAAGIPSQYIDVTNVFQGITDTRRLTDEIDRSVRRAVVFGG